MIITSVKRNSCIRSLHYFYVVKCLQVLLNFVLEPFLSLQWRV